MTCTPSLALSSASASPICKFRSSDSTTHGPAMRKGADEASKCCVISVVQAGELRAPLGRGSRRGPAAPQGPRRADEPGEQGVGARRPGLELRVELAADEPRVI